MRSGDGSVEDGHEAEAARGGDSSCVLTALTLLFVFTDRQDNPAPCRHTRDTASLRSPHSQANEQQLGTAPASETGTIQNELAAKYEAAR